MYERKFNFLLGSLSVLVGSVSDQETHDRIVANAKAYDGNSKNTIHKDVFIDLGIMGEQEVTVEFTYQPAERQTRDEPGSDAEYDILGVYLDGKDIGKSFDRDSFKHIEELLEELRFDSEDY